MKLAILDRDGTIIDVVRDAETGTITTAFHPNQLRVLDGALEGMKLLVDAGYTLAIASNQPGPAKGHFPKDAVARTNDALVSRLASSGITIAHVAVCMHHPEGGEGGDAALVGPCSCRKPKPGLLFECMTALGADAKETWMIGDSAGDVEAAHAAGVRSALVFPKNRCEICPLRQGPPEAGKAAPSLVPTCHAPKLDALVRAMLSFTNT